MEMLSPAKAHYANLASVALGLACLGVIGGCSNGSAHANSQHPATGVHSTEAHAAPGTATVSRGRITEKWAHVNRPGDIVGSLNYDANQKILIEATELSKAMNDVNYTGNTAITALNASDGTRLWRTSIGAVNPVQIVSQGNYIAVPPSTAVLLNNGQAHMPILDARSGKLIRVVTLNDDATVAGFSRGNLIIESPNRAYTGQSMYAVSPASGAVIWRHNWRSCSPDNGLEGQRPEADDELIAAVLSCGKGNSDFVISIDPLDGHLLWKRAVEVANSATTSDILSEGFNPSFSIDHGVIEYASSTEAFVFTPAGKSYAVPIKNGTSPWLGVDGQRAQLAYQSSSGPITIKVIDLETGATLRSEILPDYPDNAYLSSAYFSGNTADLVIGLPATIFPAALMQVNLTDGSLLFSALPFALRFVPYIPNYLYGSTLAVAVSDEKIEGFSLATPAGLASPAQKIPELQGTPAHWPQACSLAPRHLLSIILAGRHFLAIKKETSPRLGIPDASTCEFVGRTAATSTPIFISVIWDAISTHQAKTLFDNALGGFEANGPVGGNVRGPWDEGWYGGRSYPVPDDIKFRVGRLIFDINDAAKLPVAKILARAITHKIHASGGAAK